ncbi:MAG: lysylphosphatidylglycerol synthase domain-containing protein [Gammaproteobacteria bacterium]|nr:lysylphosphatidylglycerol synthase domain-containing protein [Gammaproteobacteria bacterium]MCI0591232.1 lysylphosphatidylglycerol synthase domain-containing protein [Gammaproteobacteria bacterium]
MKMTAYIAWMAGLTLFIGIISYQGVSQLAAALAVAGFGLVIVALFHVVPMWADTVAWSLLIEPTRPSFQRLLWGRWVGESINGLLPAAQIGGDIVKARLLTHFGVSGVVAGSSVVVELTASVLTQIIFTGVGLGVFLALFGDYQAVKVVLGALFVSLIAAWAFLHAQQRGLFTVVLRVLKLVIGDRDWIASLGDPKALERAIVHLYRQDRTILAVCIWRLIGWFAGTGEIWLAMYFLGHPVSLLEALMLESLGQAIRAVGFAIPGALGVQEGGYLFLGSLLGISPDISLALSLTKRVRELLLGLPGLLSWQIAEGRRLWLQPHKQPEDAFPSVED